MPIKYPQRKKPSHKRQNTTFILVVIVIVAVIGGFWWHHHKDQEKAATTATHIKANQGATVTANPNVPATSNGNPTTSTNTSASKDNQANQPGTMPSSTVRPATPTGQFVSDHTPNLSGTPHPNTETSACTTTPGVQCKIEFTSGSTVKSLPSQQTDENGNTLWSNWTLQQLGLTKGTWTITAIASNGSKTASAEDVTKLVVSQ